MDSSRRKMLKTIAGGAAVGAVGLTASSVIVDAAESKPEASPERLGMLYDTTLCIGCKACVTACYQANDLEPDRGQSEGLWQAPSDLNANTKNIIKLYKEGDGSVRSYVKRQCMQCNEPACAAACMFHALKKDAKTGVVSWHGEGCVGCRYCQVGCPYNIPKFEWAKFNPRIVKCELCQHRFKDGKGPACCEVCPRGAVIYGKTEDLLAQAKKRVADNPGKYYQDRVYGETEFGGTQVLYLSHLPFEKLGLPDNYHESIPHEVHKVQGKIYYGFIAPVLAYAACVYGINVNKKNEEGGK